MNLNILKPRKALNKAFLKVKPNRNDIEKFKFNLIKLVDQIDEGESEEFHKNLVSDFLKNTYYGANHFINTKGRNDLVIHNSGDTKSTVGVIVEAKKPTNKAEMIKVDYINTKAFQELVLYYLRERITHKNLEIKYLIATNIYEWFIFDAHLFEKEFAQNKTLIKQFTDFEEGRLSGKSTDFFYKEIAEPIINSIKHEVVFTHFDIRDYDKPLRNNDKKDDNVLIALFKLLSPEHLLKLPFANDSNSLDKGFYTELLHIIGLTEVKDGGKKLIERKIEGQRNSGSLIESAIAQLDSLDKISRLTKPSSFGETYQERLFNVALELSITWVNRILFLKLLEAQLIKYHKGDTAFSFLNSSMVENFDALNNLFFSVLARSQKDRSDEIKKLYSNIPYLNSSLFEPTDIEHSCLFISQLKDGLLPLIPSTVIKDSNGKRRKGDLKTLEYFFEFLNAYDFSSEGAEEIQEENKTLINASVLGLIFEKINGYKDGSFFTPSFITMYMSKETIRRAVVQKFNETKGWHCKDIDQLYDKIEDKIEANNIINSLKICDAAVGSGHFLVSSLNEIIAIKSDLKILLDRSGKRLKEYHVEVENDELIVTDEDGEFFDYNPHNPESQRIQETLFHEKQTIIENCLFGVDINPNSVKICRLRLWIELLKNAYYKAPDFSELETLPNIDINIKCGNSLISRYTLDADIKSALKKSKWNIDSYRLAVMTYRNAQTKDEKRAMEKLINEIKSDFETEVSRNDKRVKELNRLKNELQSLTATQLFDYDSNQKKAWNDKVKSVTSKIQTIDTEIDEIKNNHIYENAFEWRFEFPEVLSDEGDFVGFDVVIGNPPYVRQEEIKEIKPFLKNMYQVYNSISDLYTYFIELAFNILKKDSEFTYIVSNKFTQANYGKVLRNYILTNTTIYNFIDFSGIPIFDNATVDAAILSFRKNSMVSENSLLYCDIKNDILFSKSLKDYLSLFGKSYPQLKLGAERWVFENDGLTSLKDKIKSQGKSLSNWNIHINYGIKTGLNEAFFIDETIKNSLINEDPKSIDVIKPLVRGRDIEPYYTPIDNQYLIFIPWHFPLQNDKTIEGASIKAEKAFEENYPAIYNHLKKYKSKLEARNKAETGIRYEWYALQRCANTYYNEIEKEKIVYPNMTKYWPFAYDTKGAFINDKIFIITGEKIKYLLGIFNSKLFKFTYKEHFPELLGGTRELRKVFMETTSIIEANNAQSNEITSIVEEIIAIKQANLSSEILHLEKKIDHLVYKLYGLTDEEIKIVEGI